VIRAARKAARSVPIVVVLRIVIVDPPVGVTWALQVGRSALEGPSSATRAKICFTTAVRVASSSTSRALRLLGPAVQGPPDGRFLYLNSGLRAGQTGSCWDRRAKVPLRGITQSMIRAATAKQAGVLEARIAGTASDGGPACASVPLLGTGWKLA
jgi:hypothetical protein